MRILAINPNATVSMTTAIGKGIGAALGELGTCEGLTNRDGPAAIQGPEDGEQAVPGVLNLIRENPADGYVIACFDDTGLDKARTMAPAPVIGIGQAAYHVGMLLRPRFAVVTTLEVSVPVIAENIELSGFSRRCADIRASGVPVLDLERNPDAALEDVSAQIDIIKRQEPDCAIILGCAGMGILHDAIAARHDMPILDPVTCAGRIIALVAGMSGRGASN